jgi:hypothetical protein
VVFRRLKFPSSDPFMCKLNIESPGIRLSEGQFRDKLARSFGLVGSTSLYMKRKLLILLLLVGTTLGLSAQATTASINGRVTDGDNAGLIGATIQAVHTPTGTTYGTVE